MKRRFIVSLCATLALSYLCFSQDTAQKARKAPSPPTLNQILDHYESALGGREAWDKVRTRIMRGTIIYTPPGTKGSIESYQEFPDKYFAITVAPNGGKVEAGLNGQVGWSKDPVRGLRRLAGSELALSRLEAAFNAEIRIRELFPRMELVSAYRVGTRTLYVVRGNSVDGVGATMYFDSQSGLMARMTWADSSGQLLDEHIEEYCRVKDVEIRYPCKERVIYPYSQLSDTRDPLQCSHQRFFIRPAFLRIQDSALIITIRRELSRRARFAAGPKCFVTIRNYFL